jgi:hypothetical protein
VKAAGTLSSWGADSLTISGPEEEWQTFPLSDVVKLEISRGRKSNAGKGTLIGAGVGLVVGLMAAAASTDDSDSLGEFSWLVYPPSGILVGGTLGLVVGALTRTEKWQEVPLPQPIQAGPELTAGSR